MPYSDQEAFLNAYLKNYVKAQQNVVNSGKTGLSSARYTGQQAMNAAPTTLPDYGDIAGSFTTAYTKQLAAVEAQREKEAKAAESAAKKAQAAAAKEAKAAAKAAKEAKEKAEDERKKAEESSNSGNQSGGTGNTNNGGNDDSAKKKGLWSAIKEGAAALVKKGPSAVKDGVVQGTALHNQMKAARGGVSAEDSVDLGGVQTPQATAAKQKSRTKARASVAKQNFTTQELDARLTATNQRMRELQKQGKTKTREYRQLQNQHDTYATALGVDSFAGRAGAIELGAVTGFGGGVANMGDATLRAIRGQSASMDIPEYETASDDLQAANEQRDALIQMGRAYTDGPDGPVATPEFQKVLDKIKAAKDVRAENQITPEQNKVVKSILDYSTEQTQKAQAGLNDQGRFLVGAIGGVSQLLPAFAAAAAAPEAAPVLIPVLMGASAAGNRENELEQRGVPLNQAVLRSGLSGVVSGITNKLPLEQGAELIAGNGPGLVRAMARQALSEGGQEASEYAADYGLDVLAGDPDANFSLAELGQQALGGALGGAISAAGSSLIGSGVNRAREALGANENAPVDTDVQQAEPVSPAPETSVFPEPESVSPNPETAAQQPLEATQEGIPGLGVVAPDAAPKTAIDVIVDAYRNGTLTNKQIDQLKPGGELRQAFEEATGVTLPDTSSETRKALRTGAQNEIPYLHSIDSTANTGYDGTNEAYTGGASYDGNGRTSGSIAQSDGEGREGIPELLRNPENRGWQGSGANNVAERNSVGGNQVLHGLLTDSPEMQAALERSGATPLELRDTTSDPQLFSTALEDARQKNPHGLMVSPKTVEELSQPGTRTFMSADNMAGALVTADGDIEAVFKNPQSKAKQAATSLLITAVENGGRKLDCYGLDLVTQYNRRGFEAVARIPFNAGAVEDGWTYGAKDVYVMKLLDGVTAQDIAGRLRMDEADGGFHMQTDAELANLPVFDDYDEALAYRDSLLTTPAENGNIPELMPTANQSVQEPIPTLSDHPNTVGAAQRQFDRPEVASQSHMTRDTDNDYLQPLVQRDQGGEQKFTHERVSNADRMKIAANSMETESRDEIVSRLTSKEQWDADDTALAGSVLREWDLALGDMDKSGDAYKQALAQKMKFTQRISESNTMNAQALQMTQEFTTPETAVMQSQKSIKTAVDRVANGKNKRKFDQYKGDVETAVANAEDTATQKANDAVQKAIETVQRQVADETDQPSVEDVLGRKLAAAVNRYATDGKEASVEDVVQSEMLSQLTKMATSDTEKGARPKKPKLTVEQKLQTALDNQETYTQAWEAAKEALTERYKDNADMSSRLQAFFDDAGESGLYGKDTIKQLVSKYTKDQGIDFKALVKKSRGDKQATLREIQDRIQDTFDMDDTQAQRIAEMAMNEYSKALSEAADANLKAIQNGKSKTSKATHDQFLGLLRMGIYDNDDVQAYAASKFGVQPLTAEQCQQILDLAERAEQLPANSRDRVLLESEAATIAAQNVSGSFRDAWDTWRYTSMLLSARTNEKNIGGNVSMGLNARAKDVVLASMEWMINKVAPGKVERTTAIVTPFTEDGRALLAASANDADLNSYRQLSGTSERMNLARDMQRHREAFRSLASPDSNNIVTKFLSALDSLAARASAPLEVSDYEGAFGVLEGLRGINKNMDAAIDWIQASAASGTNKGVLGVAGLKNNYAWSLAQYLKANGADASIFDATDAQSLDLLDRARAHAIQQALINTYHAESKTASAVSKFKADLRGSDNFAHRVLGDIVEGLLPFVKTPINVAKQSVQYSPLGFVSTAAEGVKVARGTGDVNLMLDHAAASVTGSALFALGGILAEKGLLTAGISDDEKDKANLEGRQEYSLQLVDNDGKLHSYTIDWANAAAIPMFAGAEYSKLTASDGTSLNSVVSASQQVLEPLLEMSFLQGLNNNLESLRYSEKPYIYGIAEQALSSYATQGIPTLVGQVARSVDPVRRSTYSGTTGIESDIGYTANKIRNKIPFLSETGQPYIDAFGDTQSNTGGSFAGRLAYNMLSPGYYSETTDDPVKQGVLDLANSSGDNSVIPEVAEKKVSWTSDKERHSYQLSPQEYTDFATQSGQLRKDMAEAVLDSRYNEEQQVQLIPELYSTAGKIAALDIVPDYSVGTEEQKRIDIYNQYGIDGLMNWIAYRKYANTDGKTGINQSEARAWLNDSDMSDAMKDAFWAASSSNWKSSR
uniref:Uncharacterized protein n=1 Tax=Ackermannviridae sp. TaxID=2831612 RepID=A0A8S5VIJ3_9CAUD|nr:MAG TPA: hypothetical protein [Ackermannviridae sp.]